MELSMCKVFRNLAPAFASEIRLAMVVGEQKEVGIMVMRNDDVYSIESSSSGRATSWLGVPGVGASNTPIKIDELCGKGIQDISSGSDFVVALAADGSVYAWGDNSCGQLGIGIPGVECKGKDTPQRCNLAGHVIREVSCGRSHALALTSEGEVYAWGSNCDGQVGNDSSANQVPDPVLVVAKNCNDHRVVSVCCSGWASLALRESGEVWVWGHPHVSDPNRTRSSSSSPRCPKPKPLFVPGGIKQIVAGSASVLALSHAGKLYYWGEQLYPASQMAKGLGSVVDIAGSSFSETLAFQTDSFVYLCGSLGTAVLREPQAISCASADQAVLSIVGRAGHPLVFEDGGNHLPHVEAASQ